MTLQCITLKRLTVLARANVDVLAIKYPISMKQGMVCAIDVLTYAHDADLHTSDYLTPDNVAAQNSTGINKLLVLTPGIARGFQRIVSMRGATTKG